MTCRKVRQGTPPPQARQAAASTCCSSAAGLASQNKRLMITQRIAIRGQRDDQPCPIFLHVISLVVQTPDSNSPRSAGVRAPRCEQGRGHEHVRRLLVPPKKSTHQPGCPKTAAYTRAHLSCILSTCTCAGYTCLAQRQVSCTRVSRRANFVEFRVNAAACSCCRSTT